MAVGGLPQAYEWPLVSKARPKARTRSGRVTTSMARMISPATRRPSAIHSDQRRNDVEEPVVRLAGPAPQPPEEHHARDRDQDVDQQDADRPGRRHQREVGEDAVVATPVPG
jgi:hypothetical protein